VNLHALAHRPRIVIAGGGVAGLEALMALKALLDGTVEVELLAPEVEFTYRPIAVAEPFGLGEARRHELGRIAADHGAHYRQAALASVDAEALTADTADGARIPFDYLVVATGAAPSVGIEGALPFGGSADSEALGRLLDRAREGGVRRLAFAAPTGVAWMLPLYELALFSAAWTRRCGLDRLELVLVTPEERPLEAFGAAASREAERLLSEAGIALFTGTDPRRFEHDRLIVADGAIAVDAAIALPRLVGRPVAGLPHDEHGFIATDPHGAIRDVRHVYAAGDGTAFPIKQGGLAAQQADAVAAAIAAQLGAITHPEPFRPVLRGLLLTGAEPRYLRAASERSEVSFRPLWWPPGKIAGRYLTPYLARPHDPELTRERFADRQAVELESPEQAAAEEREAGELLLALAEASARRGEHDFAIKCLDAAEDVSGPLPAERQSQRRAWEQRRA
jgi:sulfide:quinone oxidoreductase